MNVFLHYIIMSRRLIFTNKANGSIENRYIPGSGVGAKSIFTRRALYKNAQPKKQCTNQNYININNLNIDPNSNLTRTLLNPNIDPNLLNLILNSITKVN